MNVALLNNLRVLYVSGSFLEETFCALTKKNLIIFHLTISLLHLNIKMILKWHKNGRCLDFLQKLRDLPFCEVRRPIISDSILFEDCLQKLTLKLIINFMASLICSKHITLYVCYNFKYRVFVQHILINFFQAVFMQMLLCKWLDWVAVGFYFTFLLVFFINFFSKLAIEEDSYSTFNCHLVFHPDHQSPLHYATKLDKLLATSLPSKYS